MAKELEKLRIKNEDSGEEFAVLFNPSEYLIEDSAKWEPQERMGQVSELQYTGNERKKLTMELFFDSYESGDDVREHTWKIAELLVFNQEKHRPPKVKLSWGKPPPGGPHADFPFTCVLESLKQTFVLFHPDGTPARAKLAVSFLEFSLPVEELQENDPHSPDLTKAYIAKDGDTVSGVAGMFYPDPRQWRVIAEANDIEDPRVLEAGTVLTIPNLR